jgi:uncharacterized protein (TIGR02117 family)
MKAIGFKTIKYVFKFFLVLIAFALIYLLFALVLPMIKVNSGITDNKTDLEIFVLSNGVHTDIVLPVKSKQIDFSKYLPYCDFELVDSTFKYVAIGWGDKGFYLETPTWEDLKISTAFKAAFGLSSTAMHVTYKKNKPSCGDLCKSILISEQQYNRLLLYIASSFRLDGSYSPIKINHPGYNNYDCFYEANGCYSLFKTCNVWTGNALKAANIKVGIWTPFDKSVLSSIN